MPDARGRIDVHSHLLPGVDDGCANLAQSIECARALIDAGYTHAFCTPHFWPSLPNNTASSIRAATGRLQCEFDANAVPLKLLPGAEMNVLEAWPDLLDLATPDVPTLAMAGRYVLFDFWADSFEETRDTVKAAVENLTLRGLKPILAHPERIGAVQRSPDAIDRLRDWGVAFQLNSYCLAEPKESRVFQLARKWLLEDRYFLIGTDTHRPAGMPSRVQGLRVAEELVGKVTVDRLTIANPGVILDNAD